MSQNEQDVIKSLNQLQGAVKKLERSVGSFGQRADTVSFRQRIKKELAETDDIFQKLEQMLMLRRQSSVESGNTQFEKILKQYESEKKRYEDVTSNVRAKMNQYTPINDGPSVEEDDGMKSSGGQQRQQPKQQQKQQQQQSEEFVAIVDHVADQEQRAEKMEAMVAGVQDLNEAVNDLNELVVEQQEDINKLEVNVNQTHQQVVQANENLTAAERYQKLAREKMCYIITCLLAIALIIILSACLPKGGFCNAGK